MPSIAQEVAIPIRNESDLKPVLSIPNLSKAVFSKVETWSMNCRQNDKTGDLENVDDLSNKEP